MAVACLFAEHQSKSLKHSDCFDWEEEKECNTTYNGTWVNPSSDLGEGDTFLSNNISCYTNDMYAAYDDLAVREVCNKTENSCWNETYNPFYAELQQIVGKRVFSPEEYFK